MLCKVVSAKSCREPPSFSPRPPHVRSGRFPLAACYRPLEVREDPGQSNNMPTKVLLVVPHRPVEEVKALAEQCTVLETGRCVARDICGSDPERMAAPRVEE